MKIPKIDTTKAGYLTLRIGLSIVFLYFGISQLIRPESFIGWLPAEARLVPIPPRIIIILNGGFEVFFGTLLLIGLFRKISAFLLGTHLLFITFSIGFTEIGIRDLGLSLAAISLGLWNENYLEIEAFLGKASDAAGKAKEKNNEH